MIDQEKQLHGHACSNVWTIEQILMVDQPGMGKGTGFKARKSGTESWLCQLLVTWPGCMAWDKSTFLVWLRRDGEGQCVEKSLT